MKNNQQFNPLLFLASLGAGGISVIPFAFFQYTLKHPKGLITYDQIGHGSLSIGNEILFHSMEGIMIAFSLIHFVLTGILISKLVGWIQSDDYKALKNEPLKNAALMTPFLSLAMTMNVFIGPIRFFVPAMSSNLQSMMLPALIVWSILWVFTMAMETKLLAISFEKTFDLSKTNFGWLLHPFALAMVSVTGTGIAALSKTPEIAHVAAFMSLVSLTMGLFLFTVKLNALFKSHFAASGLPEKQFLPSFLIVVPNITLFAISGFRLMHYLEHQFGMHTHNLAVGIIILAFAFEIWYMLFGLRLLSSYFKNHYFKKEFYISQWGLVCPFVAVSVLGAFFYKFFVPNPVTYALIIAATLASIGFFLNNLRKQISCIKITRTNQNHDCAKGLVQAAK